MKKLTIIFSIIFAAQVAPAQTAIWNAIQSLTKMFWTNSVTVSNTVQLNPTNGVITHGSNLFSGNTNAIWVALTPLVAGYRTDDGTNFVTVQLFTNSVLSSQQITTYTTNNAFWGTSNFIGEFHGLVDWSYSAGDDAGNPPFNIIGGLEASYTGTNGWFPLVDNFVTTNWIYIAQTNTGLSMRGASRVNPGHLRLFSIDHPELYGRTNYFDYQHLRIQTAPTDPNDLVSKAYVDGAVANTLSPFLTFMDTNGVTHLSYSRNGQTLMDITSAGGYMHIDNFAPDATGTNGILSIATTNFITGWQIQSSTNLSLVNGWTTFTNWTSTNAAAGELNFTIPLILPQQFFRATVPATNNVAINAPLNINGAPLTGSGIFQIWVTTNTPTIGDLGNQKGMREWCSNGICWITGSTNGTTTWTKYLAP